MISQSFVLSQRGRYCGNFEATALKICPFAYNWSAFQQFRRCLARGFALGPKQAGAFSSLREKGLFIQARGGLLAVFLFWRFWAAPRVLLLWLLILFSLLLLSVPASSSRCFFLRRLLSSACFSSSSCKLRARCGGRSQYMRFAHWFRFKWVALVCSQLPPFFAVHFHRWLVVPGCELVARRNPTRVESNSA